MGRLSIFQMKNVLFSTDNIYEQLELREQVLEDLVEKKKKVLETAPEGSIQVINHSTRKGVVQYYFRANTREKNGKYLKKGNESFIRSIIQKEYDRKLVKYIEKELYGIRKLKKYFRRNNIQSVYTEMPDNKKPWITTAIDTDEVFVKDWLNKNRVKNVRDKDHDQETNNHEWVRSKSERFIANALLAAGVPYVYEPGLYDGNYCWACPDFKVLNVRTRKEYFWEHLGRMGDPQYVDRNLDKLANYQRHGFLLGINLLLTMESYTKPVRTDEVNYIIRNYLL